MPRLNRILDMIIRTIYKLFVVLLALAGFQEAYAESFTLASSSQKARVIIMPGQHESVRLAAEDFVSDVKAITGIELKLVEARKARKGDVFIHTVKDDSKWENYDVVVSNGILDISGTDERGTMFGIYDFIENYLGVDPLSYWNDTAYPSSDELKWDNVAIHQGTPSVKFRGWFINDEDLLTSWKEPSGKRRIDYAYYTTVANYDIIEHIAEALVRSRYNLIIPASFVNVLNPVEKRIIDICARRGVYVSMHHIEPMGVSAYTFFNYWEDRGDKREFSYFTNPEKMEEVWTESAKVWATYPNVIWQVGLRGIADSPMWHADPKIPTTAEGRGKLISDAIAKQVEILDKVGVPKENRYVSTTLWMEGSSLNNQGVLKFPEGTIIVFADNGPGWKWTPDFWNVKRYPSNKYGVYYHHALIGDGPHLAPLTPATKTYQMMQDIVSMNTSEYAIFNVSNIREFCYNIDATAKILWNMDSFNPQVWTENWVEKHYSSDRDKWMKAYTLYYNSLQEHPLAELPLFLDGYMMDWCNRNMDQFEKELKGEADVRNLAEPFNQQLPKNPESDDLIKNIFMYGEETYKDMTRDARLLTPSQNYSALCAQKASFQLAMEYARALYDRLPETEKNFALTTIIYPSTLMYHFTSFTAGIFLAREYYECGETKKAAQCMKEVVTDMDAIKHASEEYCSGKWENWYRDCRKINLSAIGKRAEAIYEILTN